MKFDIPETVSLQVGDKRTRVLFAWLPKVINNKLIWLERYNSYQVFRQVASQYRVHNTIYTDHSIQWVELKASFKNQDPKDLYDKEMEEKTKEINSRGSFTLKQWLDPDFIKKLKKDK